MGLFKRARKAVSRVGKAVGRTVKSTGVGKITRPLGRTARSVYAATAPLLGAGMFLQPEQLGIKSQRNRGLFDISQKGSRIVAGAIGAGLTAGALAPGVAGMIGSAGGLGGFLGKGAAFLGKGALSMLAGGGGQGGGGGLDLGGLAGLYGAYQGERGQRAALGQVQESERQAQQMIQRQAQLAGLDPAVAEQMKRQAQQDLRAAQSERGIYESGVAARQEAQLMPQIEQSQRAWQLQQLAGITGQYTPLMTSRLGRAQMYGSGEPFGAALANMGGGGGGGDLLSNLAGKGVDWLGGLFGNQGFSGTEDASSYMTGASGIDYSNLFGGG